MIHFKIQPGNINASYKTNWEEFTLNDVIKINAWLKGKRDSLDLFSIMTGLPLSVVDNLDATAEQHVYSMFQHIQERPTSEALDQMKAPTKIMLGMKSIKVPNKIEDEPFGLKILMDGYSENIKDDETLVVKTLALYLCKPYHGKFDRELLPELETLVLEMNYFEAYALANFFLHSSVNLMRFGQLA